MAKDPDFEELVTLEKELERSRRRKPSCVLVRERGETRALWVGIRPWHCEERRGEEKRGEEIRKQRALEETTDARRQ